MLGIKLTCIYCHRNWLHPCFKNDHLNFIFFLISNVLRKLPKVLHDCGLRSTQQFIERYTRGRSLRGPCRPGVQNVLLCVHFEGDWQGWVLWNSYGSLLLLYLLLFLFFSYIFCFERSSDSMRINLK